MFDVYTVPVIASTRLRQFLGARFGNAWDHAFVYPNFDHGDGGYSTGDNPAVDGIGHWDTSRVPASGVTLNSYIPLDVANYRMCDYLLHGFGHRWLYYAQVIENGVKSYVQNPGGIHAGDYVYTAAAFPVSSPREWSTMGGNPWRDEGNGRFSFVPGVAIPPNCGYSWVDLYLMGLAAPSEVPPWFYIRDPQPIPGTIMITGTKVPVTIEQIIAANGPRVPDVQASPKEFTTLFVFLHRAGERITPDQLQRLQAIRDRFGRTFETAVGRRARIRTTAAPTPTASPASIPTENQSLPLFVR